MTKQTRLFRFLTTLLIFGLAACGGSGGGGGGGGGGGIPTATNSAITPPPTTPVGITTGAGAMPANQSIAANSVQSSNEAVSNAGTITTATSPAGVQAADSGTHAVPNNLAALVRRQAEKIKDHQPSLTGAVQVQTQQCAGGGTFTDAFDDANGSLTVVFVNCNEGGEVTHGTISLSNVGVSQNLGPTPGTPYSFSVSATFNIDLSVTAGPPASSVVTQGSFTFTVGFSGFMQAVPGGGTQPGPFIQAQVSMSGASLLSQQNGTVRELLSNFSITVVDDNAQGRDTITAGSGYTFASTAINGSVTVNVTQPIIQPHGSSRPTAGVITITSSASNGMIVVTVISTPPAGVKVDVSDGVTTDTKNLTWAEVDAL